MGINVEVKNEENSKTNDDKINDENTKKIDKDIVSELEIKIIGFFDKDLIITEAKKYELKMKKGLNFDDIASIFSAIKKLSQNDDKDIILNGFSIKNDKIVAKYLQQNCLILGKNTFLDANLSVYDNIKIVSVMYSGYNLADACLSSFNIKELADKKVSELTNEERKIVILSYTVCCPAIIWLIDNALLENLSKDKFEIVENAILIRLKHGGVVLNIM